MSKQAFKNFIYINNYSSTFSGFNEKLETLENEGIAAWQWSQLIRMVGETMLFPPTVVFMSEKGSLVQLKRSVGSNPLMDKNPGPVAIFIWTLPHLAISHANNV